MFFLLEHIMQLLICILWYILRTSFLFFYACYLLGPVELQSSACGRVCACVGFPSFLYTRNYACRLQPSHIVSASIRGVPFKTLFSVSKEIAGSMSRAIRRKLDITHAKSLYDKVWFSTLDHPQSYQPFIIVLKLEYSIFIRVMSL